MKFGKLQDINQVDFTMPDDHPMTEEVLANLPKRSNKPIVFVGCTGWGMKEWVGTVYPKGAKTNDYLLHYVKQFNTIELNTTHYRIPNAATIEKWRTAAPKDFHYAPKIPQTISHSRDLGASTDAMMRFCEAVSGLQANLGCSFMQLPPYFAYHSLAVLERFFEKMPKGIPLALEFRHETWFDTPNYFNALVQLLKTHQIATVITDVAGRRDALHQCLTNETAMIRFVGNGLHPTDYQRIDDWVKKLGEWFSKGLHQVYFFAHEPDNILAPQLAKYMVEKMKSTYDVEIRGPKLTDAFENEQMSLF
jgi:uncharacterized protein YecE (DUF72 family)